MSAIAEVVKAVRRYLDTAYWGDGVVDGEIRITFAVDADVLEQAFAELDKEVVE